MRFATYEALKNIYQARANAEPSFSILIAFGALSGIAGSLVGNPADLINVRMQNDSSLPRNLRRNYKNVFQAFVHIAINEGPGSFLRGLWSNMFRAAVMSSSQLTSYDIGKSTLIKKFQARDGVPTHFTASIFASFVATTLSNPVDVVKTRMMSASGSTTVSFVLRDLFRSEGIQWVFRGWIPSFLRLGPHTVATFLFLEQLKKMIRSVKTID